MVAVGPTRVSLEISVLMRYYERELRFNLVFFAMVLS